MYRNETAVHIQLVYILGFMVHDNNMDLWVCYVYTDPLNKELFKVHLMILLI